MPAATLSRRSWYSAWSIEGRVRTAGLGGRRRRLVGGKLSGRLGDLLGARHKEVLLRSIERHRRHVWRGQARHGSVEVLERVLGDDRRDLGAEAAREVVLVHDERLPGLAHRGEDR